MRAFYIAGLRTRVQTSSVTRIQTFMFVKKFTSDGLSFERGSCRRRTITVFAYVTTRERKKQSRAATSSVVYACTYALLSSRERKLPPLYGHDKRLDVQRTRFSAKVFNILCGPRRPYNKTESRWVARRKRARPTSFASHNRRDTGTVFTHTRCAST